MIVKLQLNIKQIYKLREEIESIRPGWVFWDEYFPELEEFYQGLLNDISDYESMNKHVLKK